MYPSSHTYVNLSGTPFQKVQVKARCSNISFVWFPPASSRGGNRYCNREGDMPWAVGAQLTIEYKLGSAAHRKRTKVIVRPAEVEARGGDLPTSFVAHQMRNLLKVKVDKRLRGHGLALPEFDWHRTIGHPLLGSELNRVHSDWEKALAAQRQGLLPSSDWPF